MWEEDIMTKKVWDIPSFPGCNKWSDDGMLAVLTANSVQIFVPRFSRESFYLARWIQLEHLGESEAPCKKTKANGANESYTVSTGDDLIYWMTEVNRSEDRTFGRLDINSLYFLKILWGPPGLTMSLPSYLTTLLSDGSLLILAMGGASHTNHLVSDMGRRSNAHLFSTTVVLNIAPLFDDWMEKYGSIHTNKRQSENKKKSAQDSDSDDGEEREEVTSNDEQHQDVKIVITDIASYPHLLSYNSMVFGCRTECMIISTGSSSGYINLWAISNKREEAMLGTQKINPLIASCVCSVLLTDSMTSEGGNLEKSISQPRKSEISNLSISCLEFLTSSDDCESSSNGNLRTKLLCGCTEGFFMIFKVTSKNNSDSTPTNTSSSSSSSSSSKSKNKNKGNSERTKSSNDYEEMPTLHMGQPILVLRPFSYPINSIVVTSSVQDSAYVRSGIQLVRIDFKNGRISPIENIHSNVTSSMKVIEDRGYNTGCTGCNGDLLMTCSLDGDVKIWKQPTLTVPAVSCTVDMTNSESNNRITDTGITVIGDTVGASLKRKNRSLETVDATAGASADIDTDADIDIDVKNGDVTVVVVDKKCPKSLISENYDLLFMQLFEGSKSGSDLPLLDLTFDPLELLLATTSLIPSTISDSREVQMNKNLERAHCGVLLTLSPILNLKWILDLENIIQVFRSFIYPSIKSKKSGIEHNSNSNSNSNMRSSKEIKQSSESANFNAFYHDTEELYFDKKSYCGLSFAWLKSFQEVTLDLARGDPRTASGILTIEQHEMNGTEKSKKRLKKEEDDEIEDDSIPCRAGISDVAWRVKDLLYPDVDTLLHDSFDLAVEAAAVIASEMKTESQQINVFASNSPSGGTVDRLFQLFNIPVEDTCTLFLKMRLWRGLHQILLAVPHTKGCPVHPSYLSLCKSLRKCIQTGITIISAKRVQEKYLLLKNSKNQIPQGLTFTPQEIISFRLMREILNAWPVPLSAELGVIISKFAGETPGAKDSNIRPKGKAGNIASSVSGHDVGASSDGDRVKADRAALVEVCTVCGDNVPLRGAIEREAVLNASSCAGCATEFDRCCVTFLTVGFDSLVSGNVLRCPICSSVALQHRGRAEEFNGKETAGGGGGGKSPGGAAGDTIGRKAFDWYWWSGKGPCCPYCAVIMLPLV